MWGSTPSVVLFTVALLATLSATEFIRVLALRLRAMDQPGGRRVHHRPTARMGGLGIFWGFCVALALASFVRPDSGESFHPGLFGVLAGAGLMVITGLLDDVRGVAAPAKLLAQIVGACVLYGFGWRIETVAIPGIGAWPTGLWDLPLTVGWVVIVTNAINLIDGLDGLACGTALVTVAACLALLGPDASTSRTIAIALAGALAGFLWFNANQALIFMGDAGSLFVGFLLAAVTLRTGQRGPAEAFPVVPLLLLAVPLFDTGSAIVRRLRSAFAASETPIDLVREARHRVMAPDRLHLHHRMLDAGLSARRSAALLWSAAATFALAGVVLAHRPFAGLATLALVVVAWRTAWTRLTPALPEPVPLVATLAESDAVPVVVVEAADDERRAA